MRGGQLPASYRRHHQWAPARTITETGPSRRIMRAASKGDEHLADTPLRHKNGAPGSVSRPLEN
jgi:hypothetical protein